MAFNFIRTLKDFKNFFSLLSLAEIEKTLFLYLISLKIDMIYIGPLSKFDKLN